MSTTKDISHSDAKTHAQRAAIADVEALIAYMEQGGRFPENVLEYQLLARGLIEP